MSCGCAESVANLGVKGQLGIAIGSFGLIHAGTVRFLRACRAQCDALIAIVVSESASPDEKKPVLLQMDERLRVLRAMVEVDEGFVLRETDKEIKSLAELGRNAKWFISAVEEPLPANLADALGRHGIYPIRIGQGEECTTAAILARISR